jgi:hypothetical protein
MTDDFRLLMVSAMYENGGNVTHRLLDAHPQMFVYPFESQLGTATVVDRLRSLFPVKYRWPVFPLEGTPRQDYRMIIDEECKVRSRTPEVSKFRHVRFEMSDEDRLREYERLVGNDRSRAGNVAAFFRATFAAWKDHARSGREDVYVGYSPVVVVDAEKILADFPQAHVLHVVRNPWSAYADHKKRPVPLALPAYMLGWCVNQHHALVCRELHPDRMHVLRLEDILADPRQVLGALCASMRLETSDSLKTPTWNGQPLTEVYPWGTIRSSTADANVATANELIAQEKDEVRVRAGVYLEALDYARFP